MDLGAQEEPAAIEDKVSECAQSLRTCRLKKRNEEKGGEDETRKE